jgi:hypothetical protein
VTNERAFPVVICPGCLTQMIPVLTESGPNDLNTTTYHCKVCNVDTKRAFKQPDSK